VLGAVRGTLLRWGIILVAGSTAVVTLVTMSPRLLRKVDFFRVKRVEVLGTRYLAPHTALEKSGITALSSVFDDPAPWKAALLEHPLVSSVAIERDLPGTLTVRIAEVEPVALARTPELRPVDARGRLLPIDPAAVDVDLPILGVVSGVGEDERLSNPKALALVEALERLGHMEPGIVAQLSEIEPAEGGALRLRLREPARAELLLPADFAAAGLERLRLALADLDARRDMPRVRRIDGRYRDQVVVSLTSG
jgi:cell division septal protein FtsQ